jgi:hypothetical protein
MSKRNRACPKKIGPLIRKRLFQKRIVYCLFFKKILANVNHIRTPFARHEQLLLSVAPLYTLLEGREERACPHTCNLNGVCSEDAILSDDEPVLYEAAVIGSLDKVERVFGPCPVIEDDQPALLERSTRGSTLVARV